MKPRVKEAIVTLFTYVTSYYEKSSHLGTADFYDSGLFAEYYYDSSITHCMMKLKVDEKGTVRASCKIISSHFDINFRRYLFAELVRLVHCRPEQAENALRFIYSNLDIPGKNFEEFMYDLCQEN
jgi:hypothetical protein